MEDIYLTDCIFQRDNQLFIESEKSCKEIKKHNWHHHLSILGWVYFLIDQLTSKI